jgi:hypothetical protein
MLIQYAGQDPWRPPVGLDKGKQQPTTGLGRLAGETLDWPDHPG